MRQAAQNVARVCAEAYRPTTTPRATTTTRTTPTTTSRTTTTTSRSTTTTTTPSTTTPTSTTSTTTPPTFPPVDGEVCFNSNPKGSGFLTYSTFCSYTATSVTVTSNLLFDRGGTPDKPAFATLQCPNPNANLYGTDEGSGYRNNDFTPTQAFREFNTFRVINTEGQTGRITIFVTCRTSANS